MPNAAELTIVNVSKLTFVNAERAPDGRMCTITALR